MRKALIFLGAFFVSTLVIYSVYYYRHTARMERSVVAGDGELPHTCIGPAAPADSCANYIHTHGMLQAAELPGVIPYKDTLATAGNYPFRHYLSLNTTHNREMVKEFDNRLMEKYNNHPPIEFEGVEDGDKLLFSYYFHNIYLPDGFRKSAATVTYAGHEIQSLEYFPFDSEHRSKKVRFYKSPDGAQLALSIALEDSGISAVYFTRPGLKGADAFEQAASFIADNSHIYDLPENERAVVPRIDISFQKKYTAADLGLNQGHPADYALLEERIKLKTSVSDRSKKDQIPALKGEQPLYKFHDRLLFYLIREGDKAPYFSMYISDPEVLPREVSQ